eukprot:NODE_250_length_12902_cov_0.423182.p2 type:complete len:303 gc:universal NODE_250_length_12902_cov_0.423182:7459-8367(+)
MEGKIESGVRVLGLDVIKEETGGNLQLYVIQVVQGHKQYYIFRRYSEIKEVYYIQLKMDSSYFSTQSLNDGLDKDILTIQQTLEQIPIQKLKNFIKPSFYDIQLCKTSACLKRIEQVNVQRSATLSGYKDEGITLEILSHYLDDVVNTKFIDSDHLSIADDILQVKANHFGLPLARSLSDPANKKVLHSNSSLHLRFDLNDVYDFLSITFLSTKRNLLTKNYVIHVAIGRTIHARNHYTILRTIGQVKQFYDTIIYAVENGLDNVRSSRLLSFDKFKANNCQELNQLFQVIKFNLVSRLLGV